MNDRKVHRRPYFFEVFTIASLIAIHLLARTQHSNAVLLTFPATIGSMVPSMILEAIVGVLIRLGIAALRKEGRQFLRAISTAGWITDTIRIMFVSIVAVHAYAWIKLAVPLLNHRIYDQQLWELDHSLMFGISPTVFALNLFSRPAFVLRAIDFSYAYIFFGSFLLTSTFFISAPGRRIRVAYYTGSSVLWITAAWLYLLIPSIGPAYRFPDVWIPFAALLPDTQHLQTELMANYQRVLRIPTEGANGISMVMGIAAFPSMHVAFHAFVFSWFRRLWKHGAIIFGLFLLMIFIGSLVTGWHYLIDSIAGVILGWGVYVLFARIYRLGEWQRLKNRLTK